jgi:hypothetical protein
VVEHLVDYMWREIQPRHAGGGSASKIVQGPSRNGIVLLRAELRPLGLEHRLIEPPL